MRLSEIDQKPLLTLKNMYNETSIFTEVTTLWTFFSKNDTVSKIKTQKAPEILYNNYGQSTILIAP